LPGGGGFIYTRAIDAEEADAGTKIVTVDQGNFGNTAIAVCPFHDKEHLVAQGQYIYFNRIAGDAQDGIYRYKTGLTKPERMVLASYVTSVVVDDSYVYFVQYNVQGVWRAPINDGAGGAAEKIMDGYVSRVLAVDDTFVYAINGEGGADTDLFKIIK
jgi:hypothetical protein